MRRTIQSFVLRKGRLSDRQSRGFSQILPTYLLPTETLWPIHKLFNHQSPLFLEIGFGMGDSLLDMAIHYPHYDFIGIEVHLAGLGSLAANLASHDLKNVKIAKGDAVSCLKTCVPNASLDGVFIFFPDPWPKKRHHKRRLISYDFLTLLSDKLKQNGYLHIATDWLPYATQIQHTVHEHPHFSEISEKQSFDHTELPKRIPTKFEKRGQLLGHTITEIRCINQKKQC